MNIEKAFFGKFSSSVYLNEKCLFVHKQSKKKKKMTVRMHDMESKIAIRLLYKQHKPRKT